MCGVLRFRNRFIPIHTTSFFIYCSITLMIYDRNETLGFLGFIFDLETKTRTFGKICRDQETHREHTERVRTKHTFVKYIYIQNKDIVTMFGSRRNSVPRGKKLDRNELWQDIRVEFDLSKTYVLLYHTKYNSIKNHHTISIITSKLTTQYQ